MRVLSIEEERDITREFNDTLYCAIDGLQDDEYKGLDTSIKYKV